MLFPFSLTGVFAACAFVLSYTLYSLNNPSSLTPNPPCRRKKKCVRYFEALAAASGAVPMPMTTPQSPCSDGDDVKLEELSDASSDADTPLNSASSPGGLSALSSLASPASEPPNPPPPRNPVGTNPRDANNPLSVGQLTSQSWPRAAQSRPGHEVISVS